MNEIWKPIPGYEDAYEASSLGRIRSLDTTHIVPNRWGTFTIRRKIGKILKPYLNNKGYSYNQLGFGSHNKKETHYWIAITFLGPRIGKAEVNHINFDRKDNKVENLEWVTRAENRQHSLNHKRGNTVKFNREEILEIKSSKEKTGILAKKYGVDRHTITSIRSGRTWRWL